MLFYRIFPAIAAGCAALMDIQRAKVDNGWLLFCVLVSLFTRIWKMDVSSLGTWICGLLVPILILGILFIFRMLGHGKHFIASKKFMKAEGGIERIVWMPKELKEFIAEKLNATAKELYGIDNFTDMIGDETVATDPETLVGFLTEKGHPALGLDPMM